jgi:hypothetical protein
MNVNGAVLNLFDTPSTAGVNEIKRWNGFSATNISHSDKKGGGDD